MTPDQRKALENATVWQARKDGIGAREAKGIARKAIRAYTKEVATVPTFGRRGR